MTDTASLYVKRASTPWRDKSRSYKIEVDGQLAGEVRDGQDTRLALSPGTHSIRIKIDWSGSTPILFSVGPGTTASFWCEPAGSAGWAALDLLLRRPWVTLRQVDG